MFLGFRVRAGRPHPQQGSRNPVKRQQQLLVFAVEALALGDGPPLLLQLLRRFGRETKVARINLVEASERGDAVWISLESSRRLQGCRSRNAAHLGGH